ncbi:centrosomal protein of 295 kDa isoform X2 [Talpa occidentalis]|nr:centrosomal protein of 295 kDa isoform X2 [Talpa occidentalis]XP_054548925.1 centrosomal protein of 295 kDa isoform X2 [Talpa occidentalis]XP_054548926.1 centrosomal protein of 295 kDa isoform X2 [Talpa occidentalis]XP_054548927.1 centrosomal protein of 295 kDa isoform X2 [Talpa occidentalis]
MKRKVVSTCKLKLSPNEEACILKEDYERRRKLRLLQVREQERDIASQIREDIKQRRNQHFARLAEELKTEWEESQTQKIKNLEKLYLASLRNMGEGHQQAKENEPDLNVLEQRAAERKRKAEVRHKEALKVQKNHKEMLMKEKTWHLKARKEALLVEKGRSARIASLPPPPPALFENIDVNRIPSVKTSSTTYHHLHTFVNREMDTKQPDPHLAAEEESRRLDDLQKQAVQERAERCEKAQARGSRALQRIHLAQNQEKLMKELEQLQQEDLARRRRTVARMPPQLAELPYKRGETREDWQRELEFAFEDMYSADRKVEGNLILHLEPEPLPTLASQVQDEELDLSVEQEHGAETETLPAVHTESTSSQETDVPLTVKNHQVCSKILFKKLLNKIRSQKSLWTLPSAPEEESDTVTAAGEPERDAPMAESGRTASRGEPSSSEPATESDALTVDSGPLTSDAGRQPPCHTDAGRDPASATQPVSAGAQSSVLLHPQEAAARIRLAARQKQIAEIEEQKRRQLELLEQIEHQKLRLESECLRAQLPGAGSAAAPQAASPDEEAHRRLIRDYQQQLLQQTRLHRQCVETARKQLLDYQTMLRGKRLSLSATSLAPGAVASVLWPHGSPAVARELQSQGQRPRLSPDRCQLAQPTQTPMLKPGLHQAPRQSHLPQRWAKALVTSGVLPQPSLESEGQPEQHPQTEARQTGGHGLSPDAGGGVGPFCTTAAPAGGSLPPPEHSVGVFPRQAEHALSLPLVAEHPLGTLPAEDGPGKALEPLSAVSESAGSARCPVGGPVPGASLPSSGMTAAQQGHLQVLRQHLQLHTEVLRLRQRAREQLLLHRQKELEGQTGRSLVFPLAPLDSGALLPLARAGPGRAQEPAPAESGADLPLGRPEAPQVQETCPHASQPAPSRQGHATPIPAHGAPRSSDLRAGREVQEEAGHGVWYGQARVWSFPSPPPAGMPSGRETGLPQGGPSGGALWLPRQLLPERDGLELLQEPLAVRSRAPGAPCDPQAGALPCGQGRSAGSESGPARSSHLGVSQASAKTEPRQLQNRPLEEEERVGPSGDTLTLQDEFLSLPQQGNLRTPRERAHMQREVLGANQEPGEFAHTQRDWERLAPRKQTGPAAVPSWGAASEGLPVSAESRSAAPPSRAETTRLQEGLVTLSPHMPPLWGDWQEPREWPDAEGTAVLHLTEDTQRSVACEPAGQPPGAPQAPPWAGGSGGAPGSRVQIPQLQDSLWRIAQLVRPRQGSLRALQEQLAAQREAIVQARLEAQEGLRSREGLLLDRATPEAGAEPFQPLRAQCSSTSLPLPDPAGLQGPCSAQSGSPASSSPPGPLGLPDRLVDLSWSVFPPRDHLDALQGPWGAPTPSRPCSQGSQSERPLSPQHPSEAQLVPLDCGDFRAPQQHLDAQKSALRSLQEAQEDFLLRRLSELGKRVLAEPVGRPLSWSLPGPDSESRQKPCPAGVAGLPEAPRAQGGLVSRAAPALPGQAPWTPQPDLERAVEGAGGDVWGDALGSRQSSAGGGVSPEHLAASLPPTVGNEPVFIPLPFAEVKSGNTGELSPSRTERVAPRGEPVAPGFQGGLRRCSQASLAPREASGLRQQRELQEEAVRPGQNAQQESLVRRQTALRRLEWRQEAPGGGSADSQAGPPAMQDDPETPTLRQWLPQLCDQARADGEDAGLAAGRGAEGERLRRTAPKPPVTRARRGVDWVQHELSAIQEGASPASSRTPEPAGAHSLQDRDPLRASVSREQAFLGSPGALGPLGPLEPPAQALPRSAGPDGAVKVAEPVESHAVLSYAVDREEQASLGPALKPDDEAETQETGYEPFSSITVSTGSFLSYENADVSLIDPADLGFPELEHTFPALHQLFRPLEPHPDFDFLSFSGISQDSRDSHQRSDSSWGSCSAALSPVPTDPDSPRFRLHPAAQASATESPLQEPEQSFHQLPPEASPREGSQCADLPSVVSIEPGDSSRGLENQDCAFEQADILRDKEGSVHFQLPVGSWLSSAFGSLEAAGVCQLYLQPSAPRGSSSSQCSASGPGGSQQGRRSQELSESGAEAMPGSQELPGGRQSDSGGGLDIQAQEEETDLGLCVRTVGLGGLAQTPNSLMTQNEKYSKFSAETETSQTLRNPTQLTRSEFAASSGSFPSQNCSAVWDAEPSRGIMEEPELTLVSTSDISITEMDFSNLTLEERGNEARCSQVSEFLPLVSETEASHHPPVSEPPLGKPAALAETPPAFMAAPGSLQEAFVKRKKKFIERSLQRQEEIRKKVRVSGNSQSSTTAGPLRASKGRAALGEEWRSAASAEPRTALRYSQLAEVKQQREEKAKQEAHAHNRARAREFHKKTLERLRAKNAHRLPCKV